LVSLPAIAPSRRHRQNRKYERCAVLEVWFAALNSKGHKRAQVTNASRGSQGRAVTACAGSALPLNRKAIRWFAQIRVTLCDIKLAAGKRQRAAPARGTPRDPVPSFYVTQCVLILRALRAQAAPSRPRPPPLRKNGKDGRANGRSLPLRGEHDAPDIRCRGWKSRCPSPLVRESLAACNVADGSGERQLLEWAD
jgi:hypothetical protein